MPSISLQQASLDPLYQMATMSATAFEHLGEFHQLGMVPKWNIVDLCKKKKKKNECRTVINMQVKQKYGMAVRIDYYNS